ncbi:hypothetical protein Rleg4DRAFT_6028 [Rhizobium leguminosarum bv. trifolii WSM2297]|uniref:Uncharacterized protein n=1 Tax=Rhizobium leguminosarum bv. trifolii WSM2297 TaxID=754762 RepID=J0CWD8_RHILT|nr:hypothetical protein [Rhizobium leguminosarum]EJC84225.1 hypothetical protein Rleg4DRAFT_6028 [Rhizobium leguminosarum bv. trifolii WSM2297]
MVKVIPGEGSAALSRERLLGVLKRADYATSDLLASESGGHHDEVVIIRRIKEATIPSPSYPASRRRKLNADPKALASWENEGGAVWAVDAPLKLNR